MDDRILEMEFIDYIKAVYGPHLLPGSDQWEHLRGAFFGGALVAVKVIIDGDFDGARSIQRELREFKSNAPIATRILSPKAS